MMHATPGSVLAPEAFRHYVDAFNQDDVEQPDLLIRNRDAWDFLQRNIPLFECPDEDLERTYYFRWWTFRKHICGGPGRYRISETWIAGKHAVVSCSIGHHFYEGRWLRNRRYLEDYSRFWVFSPRVTEVLPDRFFGNLDHPRGYSNWLADGIVAGYLVTLDAQHLTSLVDGLATNFESWERERRGPDGLFAWVDDRDGMEVSVSGSGGQEIQGDQDRRPTLNSYMFGEAAAISNIAGIAGRPDIAELYRRKAAQLKLLIQEKLWDRDARFFKVLKGAGRPHETTRVGVPGRLADVREIHGYSPWYFNLPEKGHGYEEAWRQVMDQGGFHAPFGPTTVEQRHPQFAVRLTEGHPCQWCGPSWPYSTAVTLTAMANLLNNYEQDVIDARDYFTLLSIYARSHAREKEDSGRIVPWIDEDLDPHTGAWIAGGFRVNRDRGREARERKWYTATWRDYNHSTFCDLIITGLAGLRPRQDDVVEVNPLVPAGKDWEYFCLDGAPYHGHSLTILWDETGRRYGRGRGLQVYVDGRRVASSDTISRIVAPCPALSPGTGAGPPPDGPGRSADGH